MAMDGETGPAINEELFHPLNKYEEQIYHEALKAETKRPTIHDPEFTAVYSAQEISADQIRVGEIKQQQNESRTMRSLILEHAIYLHSESSNWVAGKSGECYTVQTTEYDDKINHTDLVIEWVENGEVHRLAIDVTTSEMDTKIEEKERQIRDEIKSGNLSLVKYFKSEAQPDQIRKVSGIPRAIIALDRESIQRLCGDLVNKKPKDLAKNPEQLLILEEISQQMSDQIEYSLGLLLEEIETAFQHLNNEEKRELKSVLRQAISLADNPDNLLKVLETLDEQKKLLNKLERDSAINKYLKVIDRQRKIKDIVDQIITEKEKGGEVQAPAAELLEKNIVLRRVNSRLAKFEVPPHLEDLLEAA